MEINARGFNFRSLSFLVKLEQLDLGSNELEVLVSQQFFLINNLS